MLLTEKEQDTKLHELMLQYCSSVIPHANDRKRFAKKYADWCLEQYAITNNKIESNLVILLYIHHTPKERNANSYKVVEKNSKEYYSYLQTDDYVEIGSINLTKQITLK